MLIKIIFMVAKYVIRSVKYLAALIGVYFLVMCVMNLTGNLQVSPVDTFSMILASENGALKLALIVVIAAVQPLFGYITRFVDGDIHEHRTQIVSAMSASGFRLVEERDDEMIFRADTILRRVAFLFEDDIHVTQEGETIKIVGIRRGVAYIVYRLDGYIKSSNRA